MPSGVPVLEPPPPSCCLGFLLQRVPRESEIHREAGQEGLVAENADAARFAFLPLPRCTCTALQGESVQWCPRLQSEVENHYCLLGSGVIKRPATHQVSGTKGALSEGEL